MHLLQRTAIFLIGLGILLMIGSFVWKPILSSEQFWPTEASEEYSQAAAQLHTLPEHYDAHGHSGGQHVTANPTAADAKYDAIVQRYENAQQRLARVRRWRELGGSLLRTAGILSTILGTIGYYWARSRG